MPPQPPRTTARKAKPRTPAVDWVAVLRSGPAGVQRWNRLTAAGRKQARLAGADLGGYNLTGINLRGLKAAKASFERADLTGAKLADAVLTDARMPGAKLVGAGLARCRLDRASLAGADLTGADLVAADLRGADLTNALLPDAQLAEALFDRETKWPAGFVVPAEAKWTDRGTDPRLVGKGKKAVAVDVNGLLTRLNQVIDPKRMKRTIGMLKTGRNQLFAEVEPAHVRGIVRSQRDEGLVYSCVLTDDGTYACCTPDLAPCMGLRGEPCKHILVLLIGLARAGQLDVAAADCWVVAAAGRNHRWNKTTKNHVSDTLLKYKGVEAGEVDWRPTETIPEDFYAM